MNDHNAAVDDDEDEDDYESDTEHFTGGVDETKEVPKALTSQSQGQSMEEIKKSDGALESQKTKKIMKQSDSAKIIEEQRRINSTMDQRLVNPVELENRNKPSRTAVSNSKANTNTAGVTH